MGCVGCDLRGRAAGALKHPPTRVPGRPAQARSLCIRTWMSGSRLAT